MVPEIWLHLNVQWQILLSWALKSPQMVTAVMKLRHLLLGRKAITNLESVFKSRDITLSTKVYIVKAMVFPVVLWELDHKESWVPKNDAFELWCWRRLLRVPWTARRSNQSIPKDWIVIGRTDAKAEAPIFWPPDVKSQLTGKDPDAGKDWGQEKGVTEDEMVGWHHWFSGHGVWANCGKQWRTGKPGVLPEQQRETLLYENSLLSNGSLFPFWSRAWRWRKSQDFLWG